MKCFAFAFAIAIAVAIALKPLLLPHQTEPSRTGTEIEIETETVTECRLFPFLYSFPHAEVTLIKWPSGRVGIPVERWNVTVEHFSAFYSNKTRTFHNHK